MNYGRDLTLPYKTLQHDGIIYSTCCDYPHISRYRDLRKVYHLPNSADKYVTLETSNPFVSHIEVKYHEVTATEINRLDIIAYKELGVATYSWVIAYFNGIEDGYTVREGQKLAIPKGGFTELLNEGEVLGPIPVTRLNLGEE